VVKLELYRRFTNSLAVSVSKIINFRHVTYASKFQRTRNYLENLFCTSWYRSLTSGWKIEIYHASWHFLFTLIFLRSISGQEPNQARVTKMYSIYFPFAVTPICFSLQRIHLCCFFHYQFKCLSMFCYLKMMFLVWYCSLLLLFSPSVAKKCGQTWVIPKVHQFPGSVCTCLCCLDWLWGNVTFLFLSKSFPKEIPEMLSIETNHIC